MFVVRRSTKLVDPALEADSGFLVGFKFTRDGIHTNSSLSVSPPDAFVSSASNEFHFMQLPKVEPLPSEWDLRTSSSLFDLRYDSSFMTEEVADEPGPETAQICPSRDGQLEQKAKSDKSPPMPCPLAWNDRSKICDEQPERYEPLIASYDKSSRASQAIAVSSYDRAFEAGSIARGKLTVVSYEEDPLTDWFSVRSAPPGLTFGTRVGSSAASASGSFASKREPDVDDSEDAVSSATWGSGGTSVDVKIGNECGSRVSTLLCLKKHGVASIGSAHSPGECIPCDFYHSKKECRASFLCEYCHEPSHYKATSRRTRKMNRARSVREKQARNLCSQVFGGSIPPTLLE
jgi:hypothetical protein